jgi:hypothetical protein
MEPMLLVEARCYTLIMHAAMDDDRPEEIPTFCESIFRSMLQTQSLLSSVDKRTMSKACTCTFVQKAWTKCVSTPNATELLWNLFLEMQQLHKDGKVVRHDCLQLVKKMKSPSFQQRQ